MKSVAVKKILSFLMAMCLALNTVLAVPLVVFAADGAGATEKTEKGEESISHAYEPFASIKEYQYSEREDEVDESTLMIKVSANAPAMSPIPKELADLGVTVVRTMVDVTTSEAMAELGVSQPYRWLMVGFAEEKATEVAMAFAEISYVLDAEYNYVRQSSALPTTEDNPLMSNQWHLQDNSLQNAWKYLEDNDLRENLEQVVVAVIDTGVDYSHPNLADSMWVNVNEIPGDGMDNDNNGYVDDVYGISALGNIFDSNGDPMDEMGHGTHVAGIIAASEGAMGAVGVAYGAKIMAIKAGDSSGIFNDSDIIEGINYAIMMGADVINMSFGSYARSAAIEDALALAYTSAVLVAAAGNEGVDIMLMPSYPASYNFVIGVMATDAYGKVASFSNTDGMRHNSSEYEICAPGVSIFSTLPANRYASWSGTSMACPYISAVAAILRAKYNDKSVYSTRYIMGQLVGTSIGSDSSFPLVDPYAALTEIPEPEVSYYDYYIFDDPAYSEKNNGDGIIDAGETIGLGVLIRNHWGQARNTTVKLIAAANTVDATLCPHVTWITDTIEYGDVGTFNSANNGFSYDADGVITGISNPFMFTVSENTPNDYHIPFALIIECESYTESDETRLYRFDKDVFNIQVRKGYELPRLINQDMTLTADQYYIISGSTLIESGVTVTVEPGTQIQFWGDYSKELYAGTDVAELLVDGELIIRGTEENPVDLFPSGGMSDMKVDIRTRASTGRISMSYCNVANPVINVTTIDHCYFTQLMFDSLCYLYKSSDGRWYHSFTTPEVHAGKISNSIFYELGYVNWSDYRLNVGGELVGNLFDSCGLNFNSWSISAYQDNVFLKNYRLVESQINDRTYLTSQFSIGTPYRSTSSMNPLYPVKNPETGSTYFVLQTPSIVLAENFAKRLGGSVVRFDNEAEQEFVLEYAKRYFAYNEELQDYTGYYSYLNHLYIGFYGSKEGVTYVGEGSEEDWLKIPENASIPYIYTGYQSYQDGTKIGEAWMSSFYTGDNYWMESFLSENPSNDSHPYRGVIIEIPGEITPLSVSLECDALTIPSNTVDYRVLASIYPAVENCSLTWSSGDESVVTVSQDGKLTAKGLGTATVTVTVDEHGLSATMVVVVTQYYAPESISDSISEILLTEYQKTQKLSPVISPAEAATALISYSSSDTNVAMVSMDGTVTALSSGTAEITAQVVGTDLKYTYTVKVIIPPTTIQLETDYVILSMTDGEKKSLKYTFQPTYATEGTVEYLSSDESVVTISATGELTPVAPGNAIVWASFPEINRALQAKVVVVENGSSMYITKGESLSGWNASSVLYAEDGTTYILANNHVFGNEKLLQEFPHKTQALGCISENQWYYIDMENKLRAFHTGSATEGTVIAEGVSHLWTTMWNGNRFYYQKTDGTMWFYSNGESVQNPWLENVVEGTASHYDGLNYIFLDEQGGLWIDKLPSNNGDSLTGLSFNTQPYTTEKKISFLTGVGCFDEEGAYYQFSYDYQTQEHSLYKTSEFNMERLTQELKVTWDQVADVVYVNEGTSYWLLLLKDGRVVYAGYYYPGSMNTFADLISIPAYSGIGYCFLNLEQPIAALGYGALIGTDGSVLTYMAQSGSVLGNGKTYNNNQSLKHPVTPWFGTKDDRQNVIFDAITFTDGTGAEAVERIENQAMLAGRVDPASSLVLHLSKPIESVKQTSILLKNGFGTRVELEVTADRFGKSLTITPKTALQAGYDYTLSIPAGIVADEFGNINAAFTITFTAAGTAVYAIPVTGIEAKGETEIALQYGESVQLSIAVLPEDATMKKVYWQTSDPEVATVTANGKVMAFYNGTATVTATTSDGGFVASFTVKVSTPPSTVSLSTGYFLLEVGETGQINMSAYPVYADLGTVTYTTNNTAVATVDEKGVITAVGEGSTLVSVTSSTNQKSYSVLVEVVADASYARITTAIQNPNRSSLFYFIAEDYSVWVVSTDNNNGSAYVPRKADIQAKKLICDSYWSDAYYISTDDKLYRVGYNLSANSETLIDESVASVAVHGNHIFYIKQDGSVYYYHRNQNITTKCATLKGTTEIQYVPDLSGFLFLDQAGTLRYASETSVDNGIASNIFVSVDLPTDEKVEKLHSRYLLSTSGKIYYLYMSDYVAVAQGIGAINEYEDYAAIRDQVVDFCTANNNSSEAYLLLTADGSVYYAGYRDNLSAGLRDVVDLSDMTDNSFTIRRVDGDWDVKSMISGYFVLTNGTVLAYHAHYSESGSNYKILLGNNNREQNVYRMPVIAWFGADGSFADVTLQSADAVDGDDSMALSPEELIQDVSVNASFVLQYDKLLYPVDVGVSLVDADGYEIPVLMTWSDKILTVTPRQALREGMYYTLQIFPGTVLDVYGNDAKGFNFAFITEGTLSLSNPVTGIEDTVDKVTLSYGEQISLTPVISPADATLPLVKWESSDEKVATVTQEGVVTGWYNGTATVTVTTMDGGFTYSYEIKVSTLPNTAALSTGYFLMEVGQTNQMQLAASPSYADLGTLTYGSNRTDVVTVDANGVVTAAGIGRTLIYVTSSTTGETYYALVDVVEDASYARITSVGDSGDNNYAYFIAEDNSVWYITSYESYNSSPVYLPRKAAFQAKTILRENYWGNVYYISVDNKLYRAESNMQSSWSTLIAEDVSAVAANGQMIFYVKLDGSTYYYNTSIGKTTKCSLLTGTTNLYYWNGRFFFINQTGALRYATPAALDSGISNSDFKLVTAPEGEKIVSMTGGTVLTESGTLYYIQINNDAVTLYRQTVCEEYESIQNRIVKLCIADSGNGALLALLDDGSVYFVGSGNYMPVGLRDLMDVPSGMVTCPIEGITDVVDIATGYFVLADGTVLAYQMSPYEGEYKIMLGNNNHELNVYRTPVVSWFGVNGERREILLEKAQSIVDGTATDLTIGDLIEGLNVGSGFTVSFDEELFSAEEGVSLIDMGGVMVPITVTISGRTLIITPNEALKEGTLYTISIPSGSIFDIFGNTTADVEISFTTTGELHFAIPVQGITDTVSRLTLSYGQEQLLTPTIAPADASMKRLSWSSSNEAVATVTEDGVVTGWQNGTATITVKTFDGGFAYSYTVTVYTDVESFVLSESFINLDLIEKKNIRLQGIVTPSYLIANGLFEWKVADPDVATVSEDGTVTAVGTGVTAVYCYCEGIATPAICIVSVLANGSDGAIQSITSRYSSGFLFEAEDCVWISGSYFKIPKKMTFQKPTAEGTGSETLKVSEMKQVVYTPFQWYNESDSFAITFLQEDGTMLIYWSQDTSAPLYTQTGVKKIAYTNNRLYILYEDASLSEMTVYGTSWNSSTQTQEISVSETTVTEISGIQDIEARDDESVLYLLQINKGLVWSYMSNRDTALQLVFSSEPIVDISIGNGSFMMGESGKLYPLYNNASTVNNNVENLTSYGFYNMQLDIADVVRLDYYSPSILILTTDGKLAYFGHATESVPFAEQYSGYQWTRDSAVSNLYYIETGKTVAQIGENWILFADGTVKMFGQGEYLGNAIYSSSYNTSLCTPYFIETEVDLNSLTLKKVTVGNTEIDVNADGIPKVDSSNTIVLEYTLPLVSTDMLLATTVRNSANEYPEFEIIVEGRTLRLVFAENLKPGEIYTVIVYDGAVKDVFNNTGEMVSFEVSINETSSVAQSYADSLYPTTEYSPDWTQKQLQAEARKFYDEVLNEYIVNNSTNVGNAFLNAFANPDTTSWMNLVASQSYNTVGSLVGNFWGTTKTDLIDRIIYDVNDDFNYGEILYDPILSTASETAYPFVTSIIIKNGEGNIVSSVGMEEITVEVSFNRDMDMTVQPLVAYGSDYPFGDFAVSGDWKDARTWVGTTKISAVTGSGTQFFKVRGAVAADDSWLVTGNDYERFAFTIATSGAKSMSMQANGGEGYVELEWTQDDYETMAGYNVYRSELIDGSYQKLNKTLIAQDVTSFMDTNVEPGVQYYYYFTVVGTDLKESEASGIAMAAAQDTTPPMIDHTAVIQAPQGAAISIVANVYDNLYVDFVKLYYRVKGQTEYSCVEMYRDVTTYNKYMATIPASVVTADGVEYYIEAGDGRQNGTVYSATAPQSVRTYCMYTITVVGMVGGRIVVSKTRAKAGERITATAVAESGYAYLAETLTYTANGSTYTVSNGAFTMPECDVVLQATFVEESGYAYGDVNRDGTVNSADAILLLRYDAGLETLDQEQLLLADVNRDGRITVYDANEILRIDAGL